jgi:hypothetical protein
LGRIIPNTLPTRARSIRLDILDDVVRFLGSWRGVSDSEIDFLFWCSWVWILFRLLDRFPISNFDVFSEVFSQLYGVKTLNGSINYITIWNLEHDRADESVAAWNQFFHYSGRPHESFGVFVVDNDDFS